MHVAVAVLSALLAILGFLGTTFALGWGRAPWPWSSFGCFIVGVVFLALTAAFTDSRRNGSGVAIIVALFRWTLIIPALIVTGLIVRDLSAGLLRANDKMLAISCVLAAALLLAPEIRWAVRRASRSDATDSEQAACLKRQPGKRHD